ncbi:hypothetical protein [Microbacterium trichothecenolyticum]|uniref:Lipoprotein n=1 Tax=Microbacterium trichothecenolyticum TaxID=69370 RepID=A0ABU0TSH2_MICTR|nr:hypothetical protein [Microbacterium trichothecenolyticum]MDQ1122618.1 hypothetical protein [Microbacterium trichothecenolyticum]
MSMSNAPRSTLIVGISLALTVAAVGLAGCSSPATSAPAAAPSSSASDVDIDSFDKAFQDEFFTRHAETTSAAAASTFATAKEIADAFVADGGVCTNPVDSHLSIATSSIDCVGPDGGMQTIAVFATPDEAQNWFNAQTVVRTGEVSSYLLGQNWAMAAEGGSAASISQKLGVRDLTITMH